MSKLTKCLLWLGGIFSENTLLQQSAVSPAANRWQAGAIKGLSELGFSVVLLSHLPDPFWPRGKCRPGSIGTLDPNFKSRFVSYWNLPLVRSVSLRRAYVKTFRKFCEQYGNPLAVLSYNPTPQNMATGLYAQKHHRIPWIDICADSYEPGIDWCKYPSGANIAKGHVFLSYQAYQKSPFPINLHLDGGISHLRFNSENPSKKRGTNKNIVLYTGMLSVWGGVSFLLKAFQKVCNPDIELWICGHGLNADLNAALKRDPRIRFWGLVSELRLQQLCREASVLVNPRPGNVNGNTMNFPSKILDYLTYGKPVISTWTPGLSPEYRDVLEILDEETEECLAKTIENVLNWSDYKMDQNSIRIRDFLLTKKTWNYQAGRFINWLNQEIL